MLAIFSTIRSPLDTVSLLRVFFVVTLFPFILLVKQPDLGTALIILAIFTSLIIARGLSKKVTILLILISLITLPFLSNIFWGGLKDYQKSRLVAFIERSGSDRYRLSSESVKDHGRIGKVLWKGLSARNTGAVQIFAGKTY
jgi:cell division protein FtsW (lipid II flippase)